MSTIKLTPEEWVELYDKLSERYQKSPSILLIRSKMRKILGFTVREHHQFDASKGRYVVTVCLDFYDEEQATMFRLTYL